MTWFIVFLLICTFAVPVANGHGVEDGGESGPLVPRLLPVSPAQREALGIQVAPPQLATEVEHPPLPGRITLPNASIQIVAARHEGVVATLLVAPGDRVAAGQRLGSVDSPDFVLTQRAFLDAVAQHELAVAAADRERQLASEGVVAGRRQREAATVLREAAALLAQRRQALTLAGVADDAIDALAAQRRLLPSLPIVAPIAGDVLEQYVRTGEHVSAGARLYRIGARDTLLVEIHTPIEVARFLTPGAPIVLVEVEARGRIVAIGREVHDLDQGVLVRAELDAGAAEFHPGQFVTVRFASAPTAGVAYRVPASAIVRADDRAWVFAEVAGGFEPLPVEIAGSSGGFVSVTGALAAGANVAVRGTAALKALWSRGSDGDDE